MVARKSDPEVPGRYDAPLRLYVTTLVLVTVLYTIALATPALVFRIPSGTERVWGVECALFGWNVLDRQQPAWLANFPFMAGFGLFLGRRFKAAGVLALVATGLGLMTLTLHGAKLKGGDLGHLLGFFEVRFDHLGVGFFAWEASMIALVVGAFLLMRSAPGAR